MPDAPEPGTDEAPPSNRSVFEPPPPERRVLDGAAFGVYEDVAGRSRWSTVAVGLLVVLAVGVGLLVWRAVGTDAELVLPTDDSPGSTLPAVPAPSITDLEALIPAGISGCTAPGEAPAEGPPRVAVVCPRTGVPEFLVFVLYATVEDRAAEFESVVADLGVPAEGTDCALGQNGVHDYIGVERVGRLACFSGGGIVDLVWTTDEAPLLVRARGAGSYADHYAFWDRIVERTDAGFPMPVEQVLLDQLPGASAEGCRRDLELNVAARGSVAVVCELDDDGVDVVSSVQFDGTDAMAAWIDAQRAEADDSVFGEGPDVCAPGPGFTRYDQAGSTGQILCRTDTEGAHRLSWVRDGSRIGSVAVSERNPAATMRQLLTWWDAGGHRP